MLGRFVNGAMLALVLGVGIGGLAHASEFNLPSASYIAVGEEARIPYGWMDFCNRRPEECNVSKLPPLDVRLTAKTWALLNQVNGYANKSIEPVSNFDHWGTLVDHWDYPVDGMGDCKIYALYKRKLLIQLGFPRQALLMTIVRDLNDEGHAILTVKTDHGEFVLDNQTNRIRPWDATGYRYVKRQAQDDPNVWLDLGGVRGLPQSAQISEPYASPSRQQAAIGVIEGEVDGPRADGLEKAEPKSARVEWQAQLDAARARHNNWLACVLAKRSGCDGTPAKDPMDGLIVDDGVVSLTVA
jgi:predicted transglutaminase-like cysteine proteinase